MPDLTWGAFVEYLKLPAKVSAAIALVAGALLFLPAPWVARLGLAEVATSQRGWIGFAFVAAVALLVAELGALVWRHVGAYLGEERRKARIKRQAAERLTQLTTDEKRLLQPYVEKNVRSVKIPQSSGALNALMRAGILSAGSQTATFSMGKDDYLIEVTISQWALEHLRDRPELLAG